VRCVTKNTGPDDAVGGDHRGHAVAVGGHVLRGRLVIVIPWLGLASWRADRCRLSRLRTTPRWTINRPDPPEGRMTEYTFVHCEPERLGERVSTRVRGDLSTDHQRHIINDATALALRKAGTPDQTSAATPRTLR